MVISALFMILNFAGLAGLYLTLNAQFIAVAQVIVYAGAIMVLFLFVIMLLKTDYEQKISVTKSKIKLFSIIIAAIIFLQIVYIILFSSSAAAKSSEISQSINAGTIEQIGNLLFTKYILPFEAAGYLLLAATIGAIILAKKKID